MSKASGAAAGAGFVTMKEAIPGLDAEAVLDCFAPFMAPEDTASEVNWDTMVAERKRKTLRKGLRRIALGWLPKYQRRSEAIIEEYSQVWGGTPYSHYSLDEPPERMSPWLFGERKILAGTVGATRFRQLMLVRMIEHLKPKRVLEVGCGNGINLTLLACRFPEIDFMGIDLTPAGTRAARGLQDAGAIPESMQRFAPEPLHDPEGHRRIRFFRGDGSRLPFANDSVDLVITVLALEQMERVRDLALGEIARVTRGHGFMIEPFRDVNRRGWPRLNVIRRNYFQGRVADLPALGLEPRRVTADFPQEFLPAIGSGAQREARALIALLRRDSESTALASRGRVFSRRYAASPDTGYDRKRFSVAKSATIR